MDTQQRHDQTVPANVAIIGMACRLPGADDPDQYWRNLREGVESIRSFTEEDLRAAGVARQLIDNPRYVRASATINAADSFDAGYFGYVARDVELMDPQHRIFLECAVWAMEDAGYDPTRTDELIGVYAGSTMNTYLLMNLFGNQRMLDVVGDHATMIGNDKDYLPLRTAYKLGLRGPACAVQTACSTSLTAVHLAAQAILAGECDMALAGGASVRMPYGGGYLQNATASPDGHCRTFDARAQGSVVGNGAGVVVLKHLDDALRDGDHVYAVIQGSAINNDGNAKSTFTAPSVDGQAAAAASALAAASITADEVGYVDAHGTGTPLGDPIEIAALTKAYRLTSERTQFCAIGSVKPNIGHLDAAAGVASLIKTVLALRHRAIPPVLHFESPNPQIDFDTSPFYVADQLLDWESEPDRPRRAAVNSLGMGGANAHVVLEEAPAPPPADPGPDQQLLVMSAKTPTALDAVTGDLAVWFREHPAASLADVAFTLQVGRAEHQYRRSVVVRDVADAASALGASGSARVVDSDTPDRARRIGYLFPGQGSQYVGMGAELYRTEEVYRNAVDECLTHLPDGTAEQLRTHLLGRRDHRSAALTGTDLAQPALFVVEYALATLLEHWGVPADVMLGHSIGEYAAATLAGVFTLPDALAVVTARGRLMASVPPGAMMTALLPEDRVRELIDGRQLSVAAVNGPSLVVVSGSEPAIDEFAELLATERVSGKRLHVSHAFHSAMLDPVLAEFESVVGAVPLAEPAGTVISNLTGEPLDPALVTNPGYWVDQLRQPVRFAAGLRHVTAQPGTVLVEVGPGTSLTSMARHQAGTRVAGTASLLPAGGERTGDRVALLRGLGDLWHAGVAVDWTRTHQRPRRRESLPTYPFERTRYWVDADTREPVAPGTDATDPHEWIYEARWSQVPLGEPAGSPPRAVLVLCDDSGCGEHLAQRLLASGATVVTVTRGAEFTERDGQEVVLDPASEADWTRLAEHLRATGFTPDAVAHLWTLDIPEECGLGGEQDQGAYSLLRLLPVLTATPRVLYATRHVFDLTGEEPVRPGLATAIGLCRVLPQETGVWCRVVEADPRPLDGRAAELAGDLFDELTSTGSGQSPTAVRGRRRYRQDWTRVAVSGTAATKEAGTHLVIGGLGLVGSTLARHLLADPAATVVAYDSAPVDALDRQQRQALADLRDAGGDRFRLVTGDAADEQLLTATVTDLVARHGRLASVVYTPGPTVADGIRALTDSRPDLFELHFHTKVHGLHALDAALTGVEVGSCLVVGSVSTVLGGIGGAAYTSANAYLDSYVELRNRGAAAPWRAVRWEHWIGGETGAGPRDGHGCTPEDARVLFDVLTTLPPAAPLAVSTEDLSARAVRARAAEQPTAALRTEPRPGEVNGRRKVSTPYVAPRDELETYLASIWSELLGIGEIGVLDSFFELGGESLAAMQLLSRLRDEYDIELPLGQLFKEATVSLLADMIRERAGGQAMPVAAAPRQDNGQANGHDDALPGDPDDIERLLTEIEGLSDADVARELSGEL